MSEANKSKSINLKKLGLWGTAIYFIAIVFGIWVSKSNEWLVLDPISLNELGDLLAGLFGPLAIFWVVLGFFQQGDELRHSVEALNLQAEELKNSVEQQRLMVGITEKQLDLDIEVRREQIATDTSNKLPLISLSFIGLDKPELYNSGKCLIVFNITNLGAAAHSVELNIENDEFELSRTKLTMSKNQEIKIYVDLGTSQSTFETWKTTLAIVSQNTNAQTRTQEFQVGNFDPIELDCNPPRY